MGVGIIGEQLKPAISIDALRPRTSNSVVERVRGDTARIRIAEGWAIDIHRICSRCVLRLQRVARFAQVHGMRAHIANLEHPLSAQGTLNSQVPLLCARHHKMARHRQSEYAQRIKWSRAAASAGLSIIRSLCCITSGKALENVQARNEIRVQRAGLWQTIGI